MIPLTPDDEAREQDPAQEGTQDLPFVPAPRPAISPAVALAAPPARVDPLNLARRPFLNSRPVVRASLLLWLLGLALLLGNISLFWNYRQRSADKREQITRGDAEIANQQAASAKLRRQLDSFNLEEQNQRVDFLNKQIAERTFSWSALLDRVAERLPHDVRLNRLAPLTGEKAEKEAQRSRTSTRHTARSSDQVSIAITGETRSDTELLAFVQSLFRAPFADPDLIREEKMEDGKTSKFEISVQYRPGMPVVADAKAPDAARTPMSPGTGAKETAADKTTPAPRIEELPMPSAAPGSPPSRPTRPTRPSLSPPPESRPSLNPPPAGPTLNPPPPGGQP
jgi:hypothetical protein